MTSKRLSTALSAIALIATFATASAAQEAELEAAARRFTEGTERYQREDYQGAFQSFREAYRLRPSRQVLYNMAMCQEQMGKLREAIRLLEQLLRDPQVGPMRQRVEEQLRQLRQRAP